MADNRNHRYMIKVLDTLMVNWNKFPELRLGQLISNSIPHSGTPNADIFYLSDEELLNGINKFSDHVLQSNQTASGGTADTLGSEPSAPKGA